MVLSCIPDSASGKSGVGGGGGPPIPDKSGLGPPPPIPGKSGVGVGVAPERGFRALDYHDYQTPESESAISIPPTPDLPSDLVGPGKWGGSPLFRISASDSETPKFPNANSHGPAAMIVAN